MTQSVEKPSQAISWDLYSHPSSCQHQQEQTHSTKTPDVLLQRDVPMDTGSVCLQLPWGIHEQPQLWRGSSTALAKAQFCSLVLLRKEAPIVQSMCSGIEKALTSTGTSRETEQWQHSTLIGGVSAGNPDTPHNPRCFSAKSPHQPTVPLIVWDTHTYADKNSCWFQFFINSCAVPRSTEFPNLDQLV